MTSYYVKWQQVTHRSVVRAVALATTQVFQYYPNCVFSNHFATFLSFLPDCGMLLTGDHIMVVYEPTFCTSEKYTVWMLNPFFFVAWLYLCEMLTFIIIVSLYMCCTRTEGHAVVALFVPLWMPSWLVAVAVSHLWVLHQLSEATAVDRPGRRQTRSQETKHRRSKTSKGNVLFPSFS